MDLVIHPDKYPIPCNNGFSLDRVLLTPGTITLSEADAAIVAAHPDFPALVEFGAIVVIGPMPNQSEDPIEQTLPPPEELQSIDFTPPEEIPPEEIPPEEIPPEEIPPEEIPPEEIPPEEIPPEEIPPEEPQPKTTKKR